MRPAVIQHSRDSRVTPSRPAHPPIAFFPKNFAASHFIKYRLTVFSARVTQDRWRRSRETVSVLTAKLSVVVLFFVENDCVDETAIRLRVLRRVAMQSFPETAIVFRTFVASNRPFLPRPNGKITLNLGSTRKGMSLVALSGIVGAIRFHFTIASSCFASVGAPPFLFASLSLQRESSPDSFFLRSPN